MYELHNLGWSSFQRLCLTITLKQCFADDVNAVEIIEREIQRTNEWVEEHAPEEPDRNPRRLGKVEAPEKSQSARSIFDDIDADEGSEGE